MIRPSVSDVDAGDAVGEADLGEGVGDPRAEDRRAVERARRSSGWIRSQWPRGMLRRRAVEHPEQRQEDRHLDQQRQAGGQRVGVVLLVELHGLRAELLAVVTVLLLQLADLGLQQLHRARRLDLLDEQRDQRDADDHGQRDDRQRPGPAVAGAEERRPDGVEEHEDARDHPVERLQDRAADRDERVPDRQGGQQRAEHQVTLCRTGGASRWREWSWPACGVGRRRGGEQGLLLVPLRRAGHRVVPARGPGVAAQQPPAGQPGAADGAVDLDGPQRVRRAARVVAADVAVERAHHQTVDLEQPDQDVLHGRHPGRTRGQPVPCA